jgi:hypothetical protein
VDKRQVVSERRIQNAKWQAGSLPYDRAALSHKTGAAAQHVVMSDDTSSVLVRSLLTRLAVAPIKARRGQFPPSADL